MGLNDVERPERAFHFLVADALESLLPLVDTWAEETKGQLYGEHALGYTDGYVTGVQRMAAEVKDQLVERILRLRA